MPRRQRILIVVAIALGMTSLLMAFLGGPLVAASLWHSVTSASVDQSLDEIGSTLHLSVVIALASLAVAGVCFLYVFLSLAQWFIGPNETVPARSESSSALGQTRSAA